MEQSELKKENLSISEAVLSVAKENPQKTAITYFEKKITYRNLLKKIEKLALSLYTLGIKRGEAVLVALPNIPQAVYILYALNRIGAVPAFVSPLSAEAELEMYINKCRVNVIVTLESLYGKIVKVFEKTGDKTLVLTSPFDEFASVPKKAKPNAVAWDRLLKIRSNKNIYISPQKKNDTAVILFSGGTTGVPKAVELTNFNLNTLAEGTEQVCGDNVIGVRMLSVLPVFHGFGLGICIHTVLYFGGEAILVPRYDSEKTGRIIRRHKPHYIAAVPAMLSSLMNSKSIAKADFSGLCGVFSGGDSLCAELEDRFNRFLIKHNSQVKIRQGYGLTECVAASCLMPSDSIKRESIGKPYPDTLYKIVRQNTMEEAPIEEKGEICISGNTVMKGYLYDEAETEKTLKTHPDGKLWLHTGDMGYIDKEGFVYFTGRIKRIIVTNGHNVYPYEIEKALLRHKDVKECCAVGVKDPEKSEMAVVFAVIKSENFEANQKQAELLKHMEKHISKQVMPKHVYFISEIPKTTLGKTNYSLLVNMAEGKIKAENTAD